MQLKFRRLVTVTFLPVAFTPSRQPVSLPFIPFLAPYACFYGRPPNFDPSSRSMKLVNRFLGARYVAVRFPATFYDAFYSTVKEKKHSMYLLKRVCILFYDELENTVARHEVFIRL